MIIFFSMLFSTGIVSEILTCFYKKGRLFWIKAQRWHQQWIQLQNEDNHNEDDHKNADLKQSQKTLAPLSLTHLSPSLFILYHCCFSDDVFLFPLFYNSCRFTFLPFFKWLISLLLACSDNNWTNSISVSLITTSVIQSHHHPSNRCNIVFFS